MVEQKYFDRKMKFATEQRNVAFLRDRVSTQTVSEFIVEILITFRTPYKNKKNN